MPAARILSKAARLVCAGRTPNGGRLHSENVRSGMAEECGRRLSKSEARVLEGHCCGKGWTMTVFQAQYRKITPRCCNETAISIMRSCFGTHHVSAEQRSRQAFLATQSQSMPISIDRYDISDIRLTRGHIVSALELELYCRPGISEWLRGPER